MIQEWLKDRLKAALPQAKWTVDYEPNNSDQFGTVYYEGGGAPGGGDFNYRYPRFMVWIESEDWTMAEYIAQTVFDELHNLHKWSGKQSIHVVYTDKNNQVIREEDVTLHSITAAGDPNRIGVEDGKMQYSVNFETHITKNEGENIND